MDNMFADMGDFFFENEDLIELYERKEEGMVPMRKLQNISIHIFPIGERKKG
ncbi:hypothetical protein [Sandaracinomonas limnophila]|uniref:hypothetical protein n=1 Tax=Sandaracinomonas limnophila TaxID=1862386 RepID=UPI0013E32C7B|nr:hypothetical protein [Sandaracinomonas limnophila]